VSIMSIRQTFRPSLLGAALLMLTACGVETAGTAATAGAIKKSDVEQGRATQEQVQQQLQKSLEQSQQRADPLANGY
jgi:outer membrane lipopolysaccharide assembly protein LptE/RlpB